MVLNLCNDNYINRRNCNKRFFTKRLKYKVCCTIIIFFQRKVWLHIILNIRMHMEWLPSKNLGNRWTFGCLHRLLCANGSFYASKHDMGIRSYRRVPAVEKVILCTEKAWGISSKPSRTVGRALCVSNFLAQPHTWNSCQQAPHWCTLLEIWAGNNDFSYRSTVILHFPIAPSTASRLLFYTNILRRNLLTKLSFTWL